MAERRPYRVFFDQEQGDGTTRRGTVVAADIHRARREAESIARDGVQAEVYYVTDTGEHHHLVEVHPPRRPST